MVFDAVAAADVANDRSVVPRVQVRWESYVGVRSKDFVRKVYMYDRETLKTIFDQLQRSPLQKRTGGPRKYSLSSTNQDLILMRIA